MVDSRTGLLGIDLEWFREAIERMADLVCAVDGQGTIVYANPAMTRWFGVEPDQLIGQNCLDFVHPDDQVRALDTLAYGSTSDRPEVPVGFRLRRQDGWEVVDVRGHGLGTDRRGETMLIVARETDRSELLDELLDELANNDDVAAALAMVARQLCRDLWGNRVAIVLTTSEDRSDRTGRLGRLGRRDGAVQSRQVVLDGLGDLAPDLVGALEALDDSHVLGRLRAGEQVWLDHLDGSEGPLGVAVRAAGFESVLISQVDSPDPAQDVSIVMMGPAWWVQPDLGLGVAVARTVRLVRVVLRQHRERRLLERSARTDPLTGVGNRRRLLHRLDEELAGSGSAVTGGDSMGTGRPRVSIVALDLDDFKPINDRLGHAAGDEVLCTVADRLVRIVGSEDLVCRIGGDEFVAVVFDGSGAEVSQAVADALTAPIPVGGEVVRIGVSVGYADAVAGESVQSLLARADEAVYASKRRSKGVEPRS